ncbi:tyrosine-type recombinase/integrase [Oscillibacter sp. GMB15532]|uniref:tyrosine-type recombinase/integrase n=1 Tax=Oscillibacter sp. GMB15532 TaxID=3230022 RepID=UPI0034DFB3E8
MSRKGENIYKRKDNRWEGRIHKPDGKYHSIYGKSYKEVREKMQQAKSKTSISKGVSPSKNKNIAVNLFKAWISGEVAIRVKPSTYESYDQCINKYVLPYFSQPGYERLTASSVSKFVKSIRKTETLSETSQKKIISIFKIAMREIAKDIPEYTALLDEIAVPSASSCKSIPVFTITEQRKIENAVKNSSDQRSFGIILCLYTGIRIGELCALKWRDFDLDSGIMTISRTVSRVRNFESTTSKTQLHIGTPKSRTSMRKIPLPEFLLKMIRVYQPIAAKGEWGILSNQPDPFEPRAYQRIYKQILKEAGVENRKFHALRHSFATRALELGVDIKTLSEILGHANISITLNIYAHSLMEQKKIAIEKFNDMHLMYMESPSYAVKSLVSALN